MPVLHMVRNQLFRSALTCILCSSGWLAEVRPAHAQISDGAVRIGVFGNYGSVADPFGTCALSRNFEERVAACHQATLNTPYPWIKRWVEDALGDLYSQQGDVERAIEHWRLSLKAEYRPWVEAKIASRSR